MSIKKIVKYILIFNLSFTISSFAETPTNFINKVTTEASSILKKNLSLSEKSDLLIELAKQSVDIKGIGLYSLGKHKKTLSESQLRDYEKLFEKYFLKSFSSRLSEYSDPKINVVSQKYINEKYTIVSSILVGDEKRPEIKIDWRIYTKNQEKPLIRDLIVEGLSLARVQKEEFASILSSNNNDIKKLIDKLDKFVQN